MMAFQPNPFIFVHIPKCAGTSVELALLPFATSKQCVDLSDGEREFLWLPGPNLLQHSKLERYSHFVEIDTFFKFVFVRNPWDRAISQIGYLRSMVGQSAIPGKSFKEQVKFYCRSNKQIIGHDLGASQCDYIRCAAGNVDFIGRFENLVEDFGFICTRIGIRPTPKLPHLLNSHRRAHYSEYFDTQSRDWIKSRFAEDIEKFEYSF